MSSSAPPAAGYTLVLPPGWMRLDARSDDATTEIDAALEEVLAQAPRDSVAPIVAELRKRASAMVEQARACGAIDLYLPLRGVRGRAVPASFVVALATLPPLPGGDRRSTDDVQASAAVLTTLVARDPTARLEPLAAGSAVRTQHRVDPVLDPDEPSVVQVDYHLPVPGDPSRIVLVTFTAAIGTDAPSAGGGAAGATEQGTGDPLTDLLVELFDAVMSTFRWQAGLVL